MRLRTLAILLAVLALVAAACGSSSDTTTDDSSATTADTTADTSSDTSEDDSPATTADSNETFVLGVSNTTVGNGWREQMICAIKAEALSSGVISEIKLANREAGVTEQIADIQGLIAQGVGAIVFNPVDSEALTP